MQVVICFGHAYIHISILVTGAIVSHFSIHIYMHLYFSEDQQAFPHFIYERLEICCKERANLSFCC
jgi:hypothetical protein